MRVVLWRGVLSRRRPSLAFPVRVSLYNSPLPPVARGIVVARIAIHEIVEWELGVTGGGGEHYVDGVERIGAKAMSAFEKGE